jgi:hypothetical protein
MKFAITGHILSIEIDLNSSQGTSKSGGSTIVDSTRGNMRLGVPGRDLRLGLNLYEPVVVAVPVVAPAATAAPAAATAPAAVEAAVAAPAAPAVQAAAGPRYPMTPAAPAAAGPNRPRRRLSVK